MCPFDVVTLKKGHIVLKKHSVNQKQTEFPNEIQLWQRHFGNQSKVAIKNQ